MERDLTKKYIVYLTINLKNDKVYIGVHKTNPNIFDGYIGCGVNVNWPSSYSNPKWPFQKAVKKYGCSSFRRITLYEFDKEEDAYKKESELVDKTFIERGNNYNLMLGGTYTRINISYNKIYKFNVEGVLVKTYEDIYECLEDIQTWKQSIYSAINNKTRLYGFYYSYNDAIDIKEYSSPNLSLKVYKYTEAGKLIEIYDSIQIAAKSNGYKPATLFNRIKEQALTNGNYYSLELCDMFVQSPRKFIRNNIIYMYNSLGEFEREYNSAKELMKDLDVHSHQSISKALNQNTSIKNKYLSLLKLEKIEPVLNLCSSKPIEVYSKETSEFIKEYPSISSLCKELQLDSSTVNRVLKSQTKSTKGYILKYKLKILSNPTVMLNSVIQSH